MANKPTFSPTYVPPGWYVEIVDISNPTTGVAPRINAFVGLGSKTANRTEQFTKGTAGDVEDTALSYETAIAVTKIVDRNNVIYTPGVDFVLKRDGTGPSIHTKIDWSPLAILAGSAAITLPGTKVLNLTINGTAVTVTFSTPADNAAVVLAINAAINTALGTPAVVYASIPVAGAQTGFLVLTAKSVVVGSGSANGALSLWTGQFAAVKEPATGLAYIVYYTSDKLASEYAPAIVTNLGDGETLWGKAGVPTTLRSGATTSATTSSLTPTVASMTVDAYVGNYLKITGGTGVGQIRVIYTNSATVLSVSQPFTTTPDATSTYAITDTNNNTITQGAYAANKLGCTFFIGSQSPDDIFDGNNYKKAIDNLENSVKGVWPRALVFMRGMGLVEASTTISYIKAHLAKMNNVYNNHFCVGLLGLAANITDSVGIAALMTATASDSIAILSQTVPVDFGNGSVQMDGSLLAATVAGIYSDPTVDDAEPIVGKSLSAAIDSGSFVDIFLPDQKNYIASAGGLLIERDGVDLVVRDDQTTDQSTALSSCLKYTRVKHGVSLYLETQLQAGLKGKRYTKGLLNLADAHYKYLVGALMEPNTPRPQLTAALNLSVTQDPIQKSQFDFAGDLYITPDIKWGYMRLGFGV